MLGYFYVKVKALIPETPDGSEEVVALLPGGAGRTWVGFKHLIPEDRVTIADPEEPKGIGAVVKDGNETPWVKLRGSLWASQSGLQLRTWDDMMDRGPLAIISEGVEVEA